MKLLPVLEPREKPKKETWYTFLLMITPICDVKRGKIFITGGQNSNESFSDVYPIDVASGCLEALGSQEIKIVCKS
eukprot:bmy_13685T0